MTMETTPPNLIDDLATVGVNVNSVWDLVNSKQKYSAAIPVLIDWLSDLKNRVSEIDCPRTQEGIVRALTVREARPLAASILTDLFRESIGPNSLGNGWTIGNALSVVADDSVIDLIVPLVKDCRYGKARQMIVSSLARYKDARVVPLLIELLADGEVAAHAAGALGNLKDTRAVPALKVLEESGSILARREARKAISKCLQN